MYSYGNTLVLPVRPKKWDLPVKNSSSYELSSSIECLLSVGGGVFGGENWGISFGVGRPR